MYINRTIIKVLYILEMDGCPRPSLFPSSLFWIHHQGGSNLKVDSGRPHSYWVCWNFEESAVFKKIKTLFTFTANNPPHISTNFFKFFSIRFLQHCTPFVSLPIVPPSLPPRMREIVLVSHGICIKYRQQQQQQQEKKSPVDLVVG